MIRSNSCSTTRRVCVATLAIAAVLVATVAGFGGVAAAEPDPACAGSGGGALFVADSNFTVEYNDTEPMPENGTFRDEQTVRFRNVTLSSNASTFLRLENGTGPETCVAAVNATNDSIHVAPDGENNATVDGNVSALALGDADYGSGATDFAYDANDSWTLTLHDTGLGSGADVDAVDAGGSTIASGTTDGNGSLALSLPAGTYSVDVREDTGSGGGGGGSGGGGGGGGGAVQPIELEFSEVDVSATEVEPGETITIGLTVTNVDDRSGLRDLELVDGLTVLDSTSVALTPDESARVTFEGSLQEEDTYQFTLDGEAIATITVGESAGEDGGDSGDGDDGSDDGADGGDDASDADGTESDGDAADDGSEDGADDATADDGDDSDGGVPWLLTVGIALLAATGIGGYYLYWNGDLEL